MKNLTFFLGFLLISFLFAGLAFAVVDTTNVPAVIRLKFNNETGKAWYEATEDERQDFLAAWAEKDKAYQDARKAEKQQLAAKEKELRDAARERDAKKSAREKADYEKEKQKAAEKKAADKKTQDLIKKREEAAKRLRDAQNRRNRAHHE